jgi:hypothetical protein
MCRHSLVPLLLGLVAACGDVDTKDPDASDVPVDMPVDTTADPTPDGTPDATPDALPDPDPDVEPEVVEDAPTDTPSELPPGWPTENPTDWPHPVSGQCDDFGGFCSGGSELLCPWGYEPIERRPHGNCAHDGWCCIVAPYSECTDSGEANCFDGTSCAAVDGCLGDPTTAYECETDRVCCVDICG